MKLVPLRDRTFAKVNDRFYVRLLAMGPWRVSARGYVVRGTRRNGHYRVIHMSREVLKLAGIKPGVHNDHRNGDTRDNQLRNLRPATPSQNGGNQSKHRNNKSGFKGVSWHIKTRKWLAQIRFAGKVEYLGVFPDPKDAAREYNKAAKRLFGRFAVLNKV